MPNSAHILLVEDEADLSFALATSLRREGHRVTAVSKIDHGRQVLASDEPPDLVLLDLMLPDGSGLDLCRAVRAHPRTRALPVIILTARADEIDRVVGFEVGADDYVTKPFSTRELLLRVAAVLRRQRAAPTDLQRRGLLRLDAAAHRVWLSDSEIELTALEHKLLAAFFEAEGRVLSRDQLIDAAWGVGTHLSERAVDSQIKRLRRRLGEAGGYIQTRRGLGYLFKVSDPLEANSP